jgi:hypothetical protein
VSNDPSERATHPVVRRLLRAWQHLVPIGQLVLPHLPERFSRAVLARALRPYPQLWGWASQGERRHFARLSYQLAFPGEDADAFIIQTIAARADAIATSMTYIARTQGRRASDLLQAGRLTGDEQRPCVVTYLHYAIDPAVQLAILSANADRQLRWVVYPVQPGAARRWEGERSLFLSARIPRALCDTMLYVSEPSWLIEALSHIRGGGGVLLALDSLLDARRAPARWLSIGQARMPVSPGIDALLDATDAQLLFVWPEPRPDGTWVVSCRELADTAALAIAASRWINGHPLHWAGWPHIMWRLKRTEMEHDLVAM